MFRKMHFVREVEAWTQALGALSTILRYTTTTLVPQCMAPDGDLITIHCAQRPLDLITTLSTVPMHAFYGRCLGFHYVRSLHKSFQLLVICLSAFSEAYYSDGGFWSKTRHSIRASSQYILSPELRARRLVSVLQYADIHFVKAFWDLAETEMMRQLPSLVAPSLSVYQAISVPCEEQSVPHVAGDDRHVQVPPASSHLPPAPVTCYLLSTVWRTGMPGSESCKACSVQEKSPCLIIHCHGGGFVTQSTKSQEMFLREWASGTGCPLLSIDYSLSPEAPYPRPLEEVLMVYCWALNHLSILGTTGRTIVLTGDSAGGSLVTGLTLRCLQLGVRPPDGLFLAYTPFMLKLLPSPAKMLAVMDPMLPLSFALRCLKAYAGHSPTNSSSTTCINKMSTARKSSSAATTTTTEPATEDAPTTNDDHHHIANNSLTRTTEEGDTDGKEPVTITFSTGNNSNNNNRHNNRPSPLVIDNRDKSMSYMVGDDSPPPPPPQPPSTLANDDTSLLNVDEFSDMSASKLCLLSPSAVSDAGSDTLTTVSLASDVSKIRRDTETADTNGDAKQAATDDCNDKSSETAAAAAGGAKTRTTTDGGNDIPSPTKEERSRKYVTEFLEKYVLDTKTDKEGRTVPTLRTDYSLDVDAGADNGGPTAAGSSPYSSYYQYCNPSAATTAITSKLGAAKDAVVTGLSAGLSSVRLNVARTSSGDAPLPAGAGTTSTGATSAGSASSNNSSPTDESPPYSADFLTPGGGGPTLLEEFTGVQILDDPFINSLDAPHSLLQQFPPTSIMTLEYDFCLDDCVCMARLLRSLGVSVTLDVLQSLPHGFLNLCYIAPETKQGCKTAVNRIKALLYNGKQGGKDGEEDKTDGPK
uniref:AGAP002567-PA-like protein n=1 Tax=Hirondellea gigas TaxID=1518452 RepID=A0A6A7FVG4_9CRUS